MTTALRHVLDEIDIWLSKPGLGDDLWAVLTALRGPDDPELQCIKWQTTARVRAHAFPRTAQTAPGNVPPTAANFGSFNPDNVEPLQTIVTIVNRHDHYHFQTHLNQAVLALTKTNHADE